MSQKMRIRKESAFITKTLEDMKSVFFEEENSSKTLIYPHVKKSVQKAIFHLPPNTKIPSIRQIARAVGVTTISVQKAINELVAENILYSRSKSGIYSAAKNLPKDMQLGVFPYGYFKFATDSMMPYQRPLWDTAADIFSRDYIHIKLRIDYDFTSNYSNSSVNLPDCLECSEWTLNTRTPEKAFLPLADFLEAEIANREIGLIGDCLLPLYYQSYFVFFNPELMKKQKIPLPEFETFEEQFAYVKKTGEKIKASSGDELFFIDFNYSTFKDKLFPTFMQSVNAQIPPPKAEPTLVSTIAKIRDLFSGNIIPREKRDLTFKRFTEGKAPMLIAGSIEAWRLMTSSRKFNFGAWPLLNLDNNCFRLIITGAVLKKTLCPLESIRFLSFLRESSMQKRFSDVGFISIAGDGCGLLEKGGKTEKLLKKTSSACHEDYTFDQAEHYIKYCIFNMELNRCVLGIQTPEDTIRKATMLSRAFLKSRTHTS